MIKCKTSQCFSYNTHPEYDFFSFLFSFLRQVLTTQPRQEPGTQYVDQAGLKLNNTPDSATKCSDYRCAPHTQLQSMISHPHSSHSLLPLPSFREFSSLRVSIWTCTSGSLIHPQPVFGLIQWPVTTRLSRFHVWCLYGLTRMSLVTHLPSAWLCSPCKSRRVAQLLSLGGRELQRAMGTQHSLTAVLMANDPALHVESRGEISFWIPLPPSLP
jgi:hypothetical protein